MGPSWVLSAPIGHHVGPMNLAIREVLSVIQTRVMLCCYDRIPNRFGCKYKYVFFFYLNDWYLAGFFVKLSSGQNYRASLIVSQCCFKWWLGGARHYAKPAYCIKCKKCKGGTILDCLGLSSFIQKSAIWTHCLTHTVYPGQSWWSILCCSVIMTTVDYGCRYIPFSVNMSFSWMICNRSR